ncbi:efflux transporter, outer membrane factor (OMF) lipoprotein, NodT family [Sphingomonas palmae]|uniref:Efflux transporter, outer membrane factor (OMF) lipoprotein, NodT family n=1 Tax=Sphingomonas palmae TaxID=1855283 RepID=A0A1H7T5V0_9SPHN|nr:TolC family protein [Sphingomonas palmae]SEL79636.1 efflux transporter, outer membrane factor (OMF) lipoprotein, NodT family [Sphingomonas palmae]
MRKTMLSFLLLATSACTTGPNYVRPAAPTASQTALVTPLPGSTADEGPGPDWWRTYEDPALDALIERALAANTDLRVALANLRAAEAVVGEARNARLPQTTINGQGTYGRTQPPLYLPGNRFSGLGSFQLAYEVDLFGRVSRTVEAARADAEAAAFARAAVRVRIVAAVTDAYLSACTASDAITVVRSSIDLTADSARIIGQQERAGSAARLDVARAEGQLAEARAALAPFEDARQSALYELAALLGLPPAQVPEAAARCGSPPGPHRPIPIGDVAGLLKRRPDVAEAERRLAAATARIGVASADLYPRISLGASVAQAGGEGISQSRGFIFGLGPLLSFAFPNNGAARARIRQSEARTEAALATFDGTVLTAMKETEQALSAYGAGLRRQGELRIAVERSDQAFRLADLRYKAGSIAYVDVIVAQSELVRARLALTEQNRQVASSLVLLFRALGGGWSPEEPTMIAQGGRR